MARIKRAEEEEEEEEEEASLRGGGGGGGAETLKITIATNLKKIQV